MQQISFSIKNRLIDKYFNLLSPLGDVYLSGGFVRDSILGLQPFDIDFIFIGNKDDLIKKFPYIKYTNVSFEHDILFFIENKTKIDIKVFPTGTSLEQICLDKDFSINFLFYKNNTIFSLNNAYEDVKKQIIRDPFVSDERYLNDPILIARFLKFYARDGYYYDEETFSYFKKYFFKIHDCSMQKLQEIGMELICSHNFLTKIQSILSSVNVFKEIHIDHEKPHPSILINSKMFYVYITYLLNYTSLDNLNTFFEIFHINKSHIEKALDFQDVLINFKRDKSIDNLHPKYTNLLLFYFSNFEKDSHFSEVIFRKK